VLERAWLDGEALGAGYGRVEVALGLLEEGLEEEVEVAAGAAGVEEGLAGALAVPGELGGLAEVAADEGGVEAAAGGGREAEGGVRGAVREAVGGGLWGVRGGGGRGGGGRGGRALGGVHGGALLYAGSGRRALVRGRAAVFAGDVFFWNGSGRALGFGDFAGARI